MVVFNCDDANYLPCISHANWGLTGAQLLASLCVWIIVWLLVKFYAPIWHARPSGPPAWAVQHFGSPGEPPVKVGLNASLRLAQLCASTTILITWVYKSYELEASPAVYAVEVLCCIVFLMHHFYALVNSGFNPGYVLGLEGFIDAFSVVPLLMQGFGGSWLTFAYLRTYRMKTAFERLVGTGLLEPYLNEFASVLMVKFVDFIVVITWIGCTTFVLEGLGDVEGFGDRFVTSEMGALSFFQCCYYTMVVMSTVGFGDFSPQTVFSRFFVFFAIVGGVLFFSLATGEILEVSETLKSGGGKYRSDKKQGVNGYRGHILVLGGGVSARTKDACEHFLKALCRDETTPEVVLMGHAVCDAVKDLCGEGWAKKTGLSFFSGSSLSKKDLERVKIEETSMIFVIADFNTNDTSSEDQNNILTAAAVQKYYPNLQYRLMTVEVQNLELCAHVGLNMFNCYAIEGLKAAILATSLKCPGFPTMVLNLGLPDLPEPKEFDPKLSPWLNEYIASSKLEPYGFLPSPKFLGQTFKAVSIAMGAQNVVVLAAQIDGLLQLNPGEACVLTESTVLFALANDEESLSGVSLNGDASVKTWLPTFASNRRSVSGLLKRKMAMLKLEQGTFSGGGSTHGHGSVIVGGGPGSPTSGGSHNHEKAKGTLMAAGPRKAVNRQLPSVSKLTAKAKGVRRDSRAESFAPQLHVGMPEEGLTKVHKYGPDAESMVVGGHVVLCLLYTDEAAEGGLYAQVEVIVSNLRHTVDTSVVVLGPQPQEATEATLARIRDKYKVDGKFNVFFVAGDPLDPSALRNAGVPTADHFLSLSPSGGVAEGTETEDRVNLLAQGVLDNFLRECEHTDLSPVYDWCSTDSFGMMPEPPSPYTKGANDPLPHLTQADKDFLADVPRCHYRYASGRVLPKPLIAGVYSMAYYTPGVLELFEALIDPSKTDQTSSAWPVPVPSQMVGKPYSVFAAELLKNGGIPIGVLRGQGGPLPYVLAATPATDSIILTAGDAVYVLASMEWAASEIRFTATGLGSDSSHGSGGGPGGGDEVGGGGGADVMVSNPMAGIELQQPSAHGTNT